MWTPIYLGPNFKEMEPPTWSCWASSKPLFKIECGSPGPSMRWPLVTYMGVPCRSSPGPIHGDVFYMSSLLYQTRDVWLGFYSVIWANILTRINHVKVTVNHIRPLQCSQVIRWKYLQNNWQNQKHTMLSTDDINLTRNYIECRWLLAFQITDLYTCFGQRWLDPPPSLSRHTPCWLSIPISLLR